VADFLWLIVGSNFLFPMDHCGGEIFVLPDRGENDACYVKHDARKEEVGGKLVEFFRPFDTPKPICCIEPPSILMRLTFQPLSRSFFLSASCDCHPDSSPDFQVARPVAPASPAATNINDPTKPVMSFFI
jgi:hypothetical protein